MCLALKLSALLTALLPQALAAQQPAPRAGEVHEIRLERIFSETATDGSETFSNEEDRFLERVIAVREAGVELEFDLPAGTDPVTRAAGWQFPARILRPVGGGPLRLLNGPALEARVARWLEQRSYYRPTCGRTVFGWNAFRHECEPQSAVRGLALIDLPAAELRDGALYRDPLAAAPAPLRREALAGGGSAFTVTLAIDPEAARRAREEQNFLSDAIGGGTPEENAAVRAYWAETAPRLYEGTIRIRFETDAAGQVLLRTRVTELRTERADGVQGTRNVTETVARRRLSPPAP